MKRITARDMMLASQGGSRTTTKRLRTAIDDACHRGWHSAWVPDVRDADRVVVLIRPPHELITVFDMMRKNNDRIVITREKMQEHIGRQIGCSQVDLRSTDARDVLSRFGLALIDADDKEVMILGTSPQQARTVNFPRYSRSRKVWAVDKLCSAVLGLRERPKRVTDPMRLLTAEILDCFDIDASQICDGKPWTRLSTRWTIDERIAGRSVA